MNHNSYSYQSPFLRDGIPPSDKAMDDMRTWLNVNGKGGCTVVNCDNSSQPPSVEQWWLPNGTKGEGLPPKEGFRFTWNPAEDVHKNVEHVKIHDAACVNVFDTMLQQVSVEDTHQEEVKILLDRYPTDGKSLAATVQLDSRWLRKDVEKYSYHITKSQPNFERQSMERKHHGYGCFFGEHRACRNHALDFKSRPTQYSKEVRYIYTCMTHYLFF